MTLSLGIDLGTSGIKAAVLDTESLSLIAQARFDIPPSFHYDKNSTLLHTQKPEHWWQGVISVIHRLSEQVDIIKITRLAIDGTSGTVLLADKEGNPLSDALMYNDQRTQSEARLIAQHAPDNTAAIGTGSGLAKILWLYQHLQDKTPVHALNQADWVLGKFTGKYGRSDTNNALKMGYDAVQARWPEWLDKLSLPDHLLPEVYHPGEPIDTIHPAIAKVLGLSSALQIHAGTTDSTAAIIASGANQEGDAITSLGSTLVMKIITSRPLFNKDYGIYSQPYGKFWLAGGGSNSGGAVLKQLFCPGELQSLTESVIPEQPTGLDYYPLPGIGERFPVNDATMEPRMMPRPEDDRIFFQALLEGMAGIEKLAYQRLTELGAPWPRQVISLGGGAHNSAWRKIREISLGVPVTMGQYEEAAAGAALLAAGIC